MQFILHYSVNFSYFDQLVRAVMLRLVRPFKPGNAVYPDSILQAGSILDNVARKMLIAFFALLMAIHRFESKLRA